MGAGAAKPNQAKPAETIRTKAVRRDLERGMGEELFRGVASEGLDRLIFGETEGIVGFRQAAAAFLRALPEFAAVVTEKQRLVLLRLVAENRAAPAQHLLRAE